MAAFFRRESSQKQNIFSGFKAPLQNLVRNAPVAEHSAIRYVGSVYSVALAVIILEHLGNYHRSGRQTHCGPFPKPQDSRGDPPPFLALPVQTLHSDHGFLPSETRNKRKQCRSQRVVVNNVTRLSENMQSAKKRVHQGFQMI